MGCKSTSREKRLGIVSERLRKVFHEHFHSDDRRMAECEDASVQTLWSWLNGERMPHCLYGIACEAGVGELWLMGMTDDATPPEWQGFCMANGGAE